MVSCACLYSHSLMEKLHRMQKKAVYIDGEYINFDIHKNQCTYRSPSTLIILYAG